VIGLEKHANSPRDLGEWKGAKGQGSAGDGRGTHREGVDVVVVEAVAPVLPDQIFLTDASERLCSAEIEEGRGLTHGIHVAGRRRVGTEASGGGGSLLAAGE